MSALRPTERSRTFLDYIDEVGTREILVRRKPQRRKDATMVSLRACGRPTLRVNNVRRCGEHGVGFDRHFGCIDRDPLESMIWRWWTRPGSNRRPRECHSRALPSAPLAHFGETFHASAPRELAQPEARGLHTALRRRVCSYPLQVTLRTGAPRSRRSVRVTNRHYVWVTKSPSARPVGDQVSPARSCHSGKNREICPWR